MGQNFLIDKNIARRIAGAADLTEQDNVLEVGPGFGILTQELVKRAKRVIAIEKDKILAGQILKVQSFKPELARILKRVQDDTDCGLRIINADILKVPEAELKKLFNNEPYKIVANLPYNITSHFLRKFLEMEYQPRQMVLMVQKEVAERICAKPGQMSLLSVAVQFFCEPEILFFVSRNSFSPAPEVDGAVIRLNNIRRDKFDVDAEKFFKTIKKGFQARRKQLKNNLGLALSAMAQLGLKQTTRPQELGMEEWVGLVKTV